MVQTVLDECRLHSKHTKNNMKSQHSRTAKSIRNSGMALTMYIIKLILQFWSRKVFLDYLGTEILGLNSTATNLLSFLNIAEMGIGEAISCTLYKPIFEKDREGIINIVSFHGMIYKRIACMIIGGALIMMCFFPTIFKKMELPLWYAYASFSVLLFSSLLGYFVNYKQVLLSADQKDYKVQYAYNSVLMIKVLVQALTIWLLPHGYIWWLIWELVFAIIASVSLTYVIKATYPFLNKSSLSYNKLKEIYPSVLTKVKQLFFHKTTSFALIQFGPLILYLYTTLTEVAIYGNYMLVFMGITLFVNAALNSVVAGVGNYLEEHFSQRESFFEELFSLRFFIAALFSFFFYTLTPSFILLWIGSEFLLPNSTLLLLTIMLFIQLSRQTIDNFTYAIGLFNDVWAPIVEFTINVGSSLILGYYFGLDGIIGGAIISLVCIVMLWKPYFLFHRGLMLPVSLYWKTFIKHFLITTVLFVVALWLINKVDFHSNPFVTLLVDGGQGLVYLGLPLTIAFCLSGCGMKTFIARMLNFIKTK